MCSWDEGRLGQAKPPVLGLLPAPSRGPCWAAVSGSSVSAAGLEMCLLPLVSLFPPLPLEPQCGLSRLAVGGSQASFLLL